LPFGSDPYLEEQWQEPRMTKQDIIAGLPWTQYMPLLDRLATPAFTVAQDYVTKRLVAVNKIGKATGQRIADLLSNLSHNNIYKVKEIYEYDNHLFLKGDYMRLSLKKLTLLHLRLEETYVRFVAKSVSILAILHNPYYCVSAVVFGYHVYVECQTHPWKHQKQLNSCIADRPGSPR
jgi:hypothetical protein